MIQKNYVLVTEKEQLRALYDYIVSHEIIALDTETTGLNTRKDKIIGASFTAEEGTGFYLPVMSYQKETGSFLEHHIEGKSNRYWLYNIFLLLQEKKLITHNGAYDTTIIKNDYGIDLLQNIWIETTLAVHTVEEEGAFGYGNPFALKSIAIMCQEELGLDVEKEANEEQIILKENVKQNGGSITKTNFEIWKADLDVLYLYAISDTDLTFRIAKLFLQRIIKEGLHDFFFIDEVMPVYKEVTVPMERRGILLDLEQINKSKEEITEDIRIIKEEVMSALLKDDKVQQWIINKAFIEEYPPNNKGKYANKLAEKAGLSLPLTTRGFSFAKKNVDALPDSPYKKFLLDKDSSHGLTERHLMEISLELWREENNGEYVNIQSTNQLGDIVFNFIGEEPLSKTPTGKPQFNDTYIEHISSKYEWAEKLRIHNKLSKILSTYIERLLREQEDGYFYPYFKQHGTVTGRYGSNLQQLPRPKEEDEADPLVLKYNNGIRSFFISRPGYIFIDSDYESLEPTLFSEISEDIYLKEIFDNGHDFYSTVAIRTENLHGVSADKKADNYLKKVNPSKRQAAKKYSLALPYGLSAFALAKTLDVPYEEGKRLRDGYFEAFSGVATWMAESIDFFHEYGIVINKVGRIRHLRRGKKAIDDHPELMDYKYREWLAERKGADYVKKLYGDYKNAVHSATNFQIQSLAASVVNRSALAINRELKNKGWDGLVIAQIHDQLIIEIVEDNNVDEAMKMVQDKMENIIPMKMVQLKAPPAKAHDFLTGH